MSKIKALNPKEGDVVTIKFKPINELIDSNHGLGDFYSINSYYGIEENVKAYISGGDFLVDSAYTVDEGIEDDPYIEVKNHMDNNYCFSVHESAIESIEIRDSADTFLSHELKVIAVRIGDEMFINGHPMIWDEQEKVKDAKDCGEEYANHNRKLIRMFEDFITDLAVQDSFREEEE